MGCAESKNQVVDSSIALTQQRVKSSRTSEPVNNEQQTEHDKNNSKLPQSDPNKAKEPETPSDQNKQQDHLPVVRVINHEIKPSSINVKPINNHEEEDQDDHFEQVLKNAEIVREWKALIQQLLDNKKLFDFALSKPRSEFTSLNQLIKFFKQDCKEKGIAKDDLELAWCIYVWITHNVVYYTESLNNPNLVDDQTPAAVLKTGKTKCGGYANLFQTLCENTGIESLRISGYSKGARYKRGDSFQNKDTSHAWNAIKIGSKWHYVESTWGAGSSDEKTSQSSKTEFNPYYFLTPSHIFHEKHYANEFKNVLGDAAPAHSLLDFEKMSVFELDYHLSSSYCVTTRGEQSVTTSQRIFILEFISQEKLVFTANLKLVTRNNTVEAINDSNVLFQYDYTSSKTMSRYAVIIFFPSVDYVKEKIQAHGTANYILELFAKPFNKPDVTIYPAFADFYISNNIKSQNSLNYELENLKIPKHQLTFEKNPQLQLVSHQSSFIVFAENEQVKLEFKSPTNMSINVYEEAEWNTFVKKSDQLAFIQNQFDSDNKRVVYFSLAKPFTRYKIDLFAKKTPSDSTFSYVTTLYMMRKGSKKNVERHFPLVYGFDYCQFYIKQPIYGDLRAGQVYDFEVLIEKPVKQVALIVESSTTFYYLLQDDEDQRVWRISKSFYQPDKLKIGVQVDESTSFSSIYLYKITD